MSLGHARAFELMSAHARGLVMAASRCSDPPGEDQEDKDESDENIKVEISDQAQDLSMKRSIAEVDDNPREPEAKRRKTQSSEDGRDDEDSS